MSCDCDDYYEESATIVLLEEAQINQADWVIGALRKYIQGKIEIASHGNFMAKTQQARVEAIVKFTQNYMIYQLWRETL